MGSPTLNNGMLPTVSGFLTYIKGLRPKKRIGLAFGSYGWGGQGAREVDAVLKSMGWETPIDLINLQYLPDRQEMDTAREAGRKIGAAVLEQAL